MDLGLKNRVAMVTGSSRGIGKAIATSLASEGARLVMCARGRTSLEAAAEEIREATRTDALAVVADVSRREDVTELVDKTMETYSRIDVLVNNTGGPPPKLFLETSQKDWQEAVELLLMSVINLTQQVTPYMKTQGWGRIINMTSFAAKQPAERLVLSNSIRAGILGLTKTMSDELAQHGILVNAVCPGWTLTDRVATLASSTAALTNRTTEDIVKEWESRIPLRRLARPTEIADVVTFLASERASYITGSVISVDGGFTRSLL